MFQLVALDVDGTLFDSSHKLPPRNKTVIRQLVERGVHVSLSTGKSFSTIQNLVQELNLVSPQITSDGASIVDPLTQSPLYRIGLSKGLAIEALTVLEELNVTIVIVSENTSFTKEINEDIEYMCNYGDPTPFVVKNLIGSIEIEPTHLMVVSYKKDNLYNRVFQTLKDTFGSRLNIVKSSPYFIEILNPLASKGNALNTVLKHLQIKKERVLCIGDGLNDLTMFQNVGLSIAMGNSHPDVKTAAGFVTDTNDNLGVAKALEKYFDDLIR
jgi:Cof subfamily protein (haloacid dehalogenase superfamily)